jgi:hypothetical protein
MTDLLALPYHLSVDESSWARASFSWALTNHVERMHDCAAKMSPAARVEVLTCLSLLADTLRGLECRDVAAALVVAT